jgi:integrase
VSDLGFCSRESLPQALDCGVTASNLADVTTARRSDVAELTVLLTSWRLHLEAANLSARTIRAYTDDTALFARFLADRGMPTTAAGIHREHVEAFIAAELVRTAPSSAATRYRSLQQFFRWLADEGEIDASPMAKMHPPIIPEQPVPVLPDDQVRRLLDSCAGRDFRARRDMAIIRVFLDTGMRLEGMGGLRYSAEDGDLSDVDLVRAWSASPQGADARWCYRSARSPRATWIGTSGCARPTRAPSSRGCGSAPRGGSRPAASTR